MVDIHSIFLTVPFMITSAPIYFHLTLQALYLGHSVVGQCALAALAWSGKLCQ